MGSARKLQTADRGIKADVLAVIDQPPVPWRQRRYDLSATAAAAAMNHGSVEHGHIQCPLLQCGGNTLDELDRKLIH